VFLHKTNAIHAGYSTKKPFRIKTFVFLTLIALFLGVFAFIQARAESLLIYDFDKTPNACDNIRYAVAENLFIAVSQMGSSTERSQDLMFNYTANAGHPATVYNTFCKD